MLQYIIPVIALSALAAGWIGVQFLARKLHTKNHFDDLHSCGSCHCGGEITSCDRLLDNAPSTSHPHDK